MVRLQTPARTALSLGLALALALVFGPAPDARALEADAPIEAIQTCMSDNLRGESSVQSLEMIPRDRMGSERTIAANVYWKRFDDGYSRVLARFTAPADIEGAAFLLIETETRADMFLYLPELRKQRRITTQSLRGKIYDTDFSYEDFERLQGFNHAEKPERLPDGEVDGRAVFVLQVRPAPDSGSAYDRIVTHVEQERCVPLKTELYEGPERLRKTFTVDPAGVRKSGDSWIPGELVMRDLRDETETRLRILELEIDKEIPNKAFRLDRLGRGWDP
jgi:hypothetical protein